MKRSLLAFALLSISMLAPANADVLQRLKLSPENARQDLTAALADGSPPYWRESFRVLKAASPAARAQLIDQLAAWTKAYTESSEFAQAYAVLRMEQKPEAPAIRGSVDDEIKQQWSQRLADLEAMRQSIQKMPAESRKDAEEAYRIMKAQLEQQARNTDIQRIEKEILEQQRRDDRERYRQRLARWEEELPADPRALIRGRLTEFLELTANVDYDAKLVTKHGRQRFAREDYERESAPWKAAYRLGREPTETARAFASRWLAELK